MNIINFMRIFMYLLEKEMRQHISELRDIPFQSDEANTDRPLKELVKKIIIDELKCIPGSYYGYELRLLEKDREHCIPFSVFKDVHIKKVYLPDEITEEIKRIVAINRHNVIYTNPDILLQIESNGRIVFQSIELKSTKKDSIPGSSIQQVNPGEWAIFVKHNAQKVEIATGQYIHAINSKLQFPDRSPRPQVSFSELKMWNDRNRIAEQTLLSYVTDSDDVEKYALLNDWQGFLADRWVEMLFNGADAKHKETWFNNNMRRFILKFLTRYDELNEDAKLKFKNDVSTLIR